MSAKSDMDVLVVDDEALQREMMVDYLVNEGHHAIGAENGEKAIELVKSRFFDLVLIDYKMPGKNGIEVLAEVKGINPEIDGVIITAYGTIETAVSAMKSGAVDYISKPVNLEALSILISRASERRTLIRENEMLRQALEKNRVSTGKIIYKSDKMQALINMAGRVASSKATILLQGETGTGKELFARLIHGASDRAGAPFVAVNCGAIPEGLIESELFGHEKGAFTGAQKMRVGHFEQAGGGTLFLDEIGELPVGVQVKLLRFLQERQFQRVGGDRVIASDVRIISATHQDLESRVKDGTFREDLFYRVNVIALKIPPLRERKEDIKILADYFISRFAAENRSRVISISREAMDLLIKYDFPGNVRELENIIERGVVIARGATITCNELPFGNNGLVEQPKAVEAGSLQEAVDALEVRMIENALSETGTNQTRAAEKLGLSERMLRYKLKKYGIRKK